MLASTVTTRFLSTWARCANRLFFSPSRPRLQVNCLTDYLYDDAISQAKQLDEHFTKHKEVVGPLHGIPVSLKEQIRLRGTRSSVGFVAWLSNVETPETESEIVKILRSAGAVFHVKTNVPTSLMVSYTHLSQW